MVTTTTPGGQRVSICTCTPTGRHLATLIRQPWSSLYTLATKPPQVATSAQVSASGQVSACLPCIKGRQCAAPHSSSFPPTTAPLHTLHMDVWGPARVSGQGRERYFLLVVDDYTRYTTVFPLHSKGEVPDVLIPWIRTVRLHQRERFRQDLPILRLHSDRSGEFSSDLLRYFCCGEGILQSFTLLASRQQNGIAERRIGLVLEVVRTSMIHAPAPHFLWPFAVQYAAHQLNFWPRVSLPEISPTLPWTGKVGDALVVLLPQVLLEVLRLGVRRLGGAEPGGAESEGAGSGGVEPWGAEPEGNEPRGAESEGAESGGAEPWGGKSEGARSGVVEPCGAESGPASPLPAPSPYTEQTRGLTERREPQSRPASPVRAVHTGRRVPRQRPPPVFSTHAMALRPSSSDLANAASHTVSHLLATVVNDPSFESTTTSALVAELVDFAATCRLDYPTALVAEPASASPPSVGGECALGTDVIEDRQEDFECLAVAVPCFASMLLAPEGDPDAPDIPTPRSYAEAITGTYVDAVPPCRANIVDGTWIFRVKRPPGSPLAFKARYVAKGFSQRQGVDSFQKMTTLRVLLHVAAQRDYELDSLNFSTAFMQGSLHKEIWLRHPPGFTESFPADPSLSLRTDTLLPSFYVLVYLGLQITRDRAQPTTTQTQPDMVYKVLQRSGFQFSSPQPTSLSTGHSLLAPPSDASVEPSDASWDDDLATQRSSQGYTFSLGSGSVSWQSTRSSSVLNSSCEAEIYAGAMTAQELRWLTYLLTDLGEQPRSPPVLYVDNNAMIALCQEHRLEHKTKHIALRYFLARELLQRGQLSLAYVATRANTADIFTKALPPSDHKRFSNV
ncbi:unnamed protein product [Closterium sp. NIES-54]